MEVVQRVTLSTSSSSSSSSSASSSDLNYLSFSPACCGSSIPSPPPALLPSIPVPVPPFGLAIPCCRSDPSVRCRLPSDPPPLAGKLYLLDHADALRNEQADLAKWQKSHLPPRKEPSKLILFGPSRSTTATTITSSRNGNSVSTSGGNVGFVSSSFFSATNGKQEASASASSATGSGSGSRETDNDVTVIGSISNTNNHHSTSTSTSTSKPAACALIGTTPNSIHPSTTLLPLRPLPLPSVARSLRDQDSVTTLPSSVMKFDASGTARPGVVSHDVAAVTGNGVGPPAPIAVQSNQLQQLPALCLPEEDSLRVAHTPSVEQLRHQKSQSQQLEQQGQQAGGRQQGALGGMSNRNGGGQMTIAGSLPDGADVANAGLPLVVASPMLSPSTTGDASGLLAAQPLSIQGQQQQLMVATVAAIAQLGNGDDDGMEEDDEIDELQHFGVQDDEEEPNLLKPLVNRYSSANTHCTDDDEEDVDSDCCSVGSHVEDEEQERSSCLPAPENHDLAAPKQQHSFPNSNCIVNTKADVAYSHSSIRHQQSKLHCFNLEAVLGGRLVEPSPSKVEDDEDDEDDDGEEDDDDDEDEEVHSDGVGAEFDDDEDPEEATQMARELAEAQRQQKQQPQRHNDDDDDDDDEDDEEEEDEDEDEERRHIKVLQRQINEQEDAEERAAAAAGGGAGMEEDEEDEDYEENAEDEDDSEGSMSDGDAEEVDEDQDHQHQDDELDKAAPACPLTRVTRSTRSATASTSTQPPSSSPPQPMGRTRQQHRQQQQQLQLQQPFSSVDTASQSAPVGHALTADTIPASLSPTYEGSASVPSSTSFAPASNAADADAAACVGGLVIPMITGVSTRHSCKRKQPTTPPPLPAFDKQLLSPLRPGLPNVVHSNPQHTDNAEVIAAGAHTENSGDVAADANGMAADDDSSTVSASASTSASKRHATGVRNQQLQ